MNSGTVLVIGGTGQQGGAALRALLDRGWRARALARDPRSERARALAEQGVDVVAGDLEDRSSLDSAAQGMDGVFCVAPLLTSLRPGATFDHQLGCVKGVIDAAEMAGVPHVVLSSASGADRGVNKNRNTKLMMESHLRTKDMTWTVLRPVSFMDNFVLPQWGVQQGVFTTALWATTRQQMVAVDDVAAMAAIAFEQPDKMGSKIVELAGDDLTPVEMAQALTEALGRCIPYLQVSTDLLARINPGMATGYVSLNGGERTPIDIGALGTIHPGLMTFKTWLSRMGAGRLTPLLPRASGGMLDALPMWRLESMSS